MFHRILLLWMLAAASLSAEMIPFTLPWDDNSDNITNFADTMHAPAGRWGRIAVSDDGHYTIQGQRVRIFGVNIVGPACYPSKEDAPRIAQRIARMGFNSVRFHHMDNPWGAGLIDYDSGNSRELDMEYLDRLDFFINELSKVGVYSNLNLVCSRIFKEEDGLDPSIESLENKVQHALGMIDEDLLALQKEYASKLILHRNPYTGMTYAKDPAIAIVEINNENGLAHQWYSGNLDELPEVFASNLSLRWNSWLQAKYDDMESLEQSWEVVDEAPGTNQVNGSFESDTAGWNFEQHENATGTFEIGVYDGRQSLRISTLTTGDSWHIQINFPNLNIEKGRAYTLTFWAKASDAFNMPITLRQAYKPWGAIGLSTSSSLGTRWQEYEYTFLAKEDDDQARIGFSGMGTFEGSVYLDEVEFRSGGQIGVFPDTIALEQGNIPSIKFNDASSTLPMQKRDWMEFLWEIENTYWAGMKNYIEDTLEFGGLTWGTTIMNSPPSIQAMFATADTHAYWKHPQFPETPWSPTIWTVGNGSMVNESNGGNIGTLARKAIQGKPHNVSEYQHSSPNTYSSEAALFLSFYASLQNWDGLYLFHYGSGEDNYDRGYFDGFFDIDQHSSKLANAVLASWLFRSFAIAPARETLVFAFDADTQLDVLQDYGSAWNVANLSHLDLPPQWALIHAIRMDLEGGVDSLTEIAPPPETSTYISDTEEISWDLSQSEAGILSLNTPTAKAVIGHDAGRSFDLGELTFNPGNSEQGWCTFVAVLREGSFERLNTAGARGIIVTTGNTENTNMEWTDATKTSVSNHWGTAPVLVENIPATVSLAVDASQLRVWSLDERGDRDENLEIASDGNGGALFNLGGSTGSLWYEFEVSPTQAASPVEFLRIAHRTSSEVALYWPEMDDAANYQLQMSVNESAWDDASGLMGPVSGTGMRHILLPGLPEGAAIQLRIVATNPTGDSEAVILDTYTRNSYQLWAASRFSSAELAVKSISGAIADPDQDHLSNEVEAALGLDPLSADAFPFPMPVREPDQARHWVLSIDSELLNPSGPRLRLLSSEDLETWTLRESYEDASPEPRFVFRIDLADAAQDRFFWSWTTDDGI